MRTLIIHHLETIWKAGYERFGVTFEIMAEKVVDYLREHEYDQIILTRFEDDRLEDEHHYTGLSEFIHQVFTYAYGWCQEDVLDDEDDENWTEGGYHSEYVYLAPWMRTLAGCKVDICGAFDGECIEDLEIALEALEIPFNRIEELII